MSFRYALCSMVCAGFVSFLCPNPRWLGWITDSLNYSYKLLKDSAVLKESFEWQWFDNELLPPAGRFSDNIQNLVFKTLIS